ncbi:putative FBD-associated F-box protein [Citrus sinensis]|uniref:FBD-associated F-box protein n=1 Tax=Citrus sinensis TaxID=2711 RepID=A0ACB8P151_CITSI|nr:putative FBD-associated F-box protein [Citrus sinensis]
MENALQRSPIISKLTCGVCYNVGGEDGDRLSNLPEPIIHHIFSFLETIDVVRASAVSRKWSRLKSLDLQHVEVLDYNLFREFLSSCPLLENFCKVICESLEALKLHFGREIDSSPLLENLKMDSCCFPDLKILDISSNSLKSLTLERIEFGGDELDNYKLKIACSNLESFNIFAPLLPDFTLESLNSLQNAFIFLETIGEYMEAKEICHRMSKILNGLRDVKVLKLSCTLYQDEYYDDWEIPDKVILCLTCHLKTVELIDFSGNENELELVRFLLKNGHVLQKLRVSWLERCGES